MGPQREQPSCLGIIGPVFSHSVRHVMAPNFLSHLIKIVLGITYHPPPIICFLLTDLIFCHWLFCSILFIVCPQGDAICHFCNNRFNLPGQIKFSLCLKTLSFSSPFPAGSPLQPAPTRLAASHLDSPFLVRHVSLLSPVGCHAFCHSIWKVLHSKSLYFVPASSCSVLHTLDTQYMFDDYELAVCRLPTIFNRVS